MIQKQIQLEIFESGHKAKKDYVIDKAEIEKTAQAKFPTQLCVKIAIVLIMIIISFALGIERGRSVSQSVGGSSRVIAEKKITQPPKDNLPIKQNIQQKQTVVNENTKSVSSDEYIVQVATYKRDSSYVEKEVSKLKQKGYVAVLIPSDDWMQLCAGKFSNKKVADEHKKKLEQTYKGCFIRKI